MVAMTTDLFKEYFLTPASATWTDLKNGAQNSITAANLSGNFWNLLICSAPVIAGHQVAHKINSYAHQSRLIHNNPLYSFVSTTISCVAGTTASFIAIRVLSHLGATLAPFSADKALHLATLYTVVSATVVPISKFFGIQLPFFTEYPTMIATYVLEGKDKDSIYSLKIKLPLFTGSLFLGATAAAGYFGDRSLYVIGALSALTGAVNALKA
jgi:hypothetical protein